MTNRNISVLILTYNESLHLDRCLTSLSKFCNNFFIIDSFSSDNTLDIAKKHNAVVFQRKWTNYSDQFQWGLDNCPIQTDWVMRMDADEYVEPDLASEINLKLQNAPHNISGFYIRRKYFFMGRWVKYGAVYPLKLLRIWRHGQGRIENRWMDEHIVLKPNLITHNLNGHIIDDNLNNTKWWTDKHNKYADREMIDILIRKYDLLPVDNELHRDDEKTQAKIKRFVKDKIYNRLPIFVRPLLYFLYRYFLRIGFLDGKTGFAFHFFQGYWYRSLVDLRVCEAEMSFSPSDTKQQMIDKIEQLTGHKLK